MHRIITFLKIGILGLLLTSCVGASQSPYIASTDDLENGCLPPIADFSYPLGENREFPADPTVLPPQPWKLVSEIPGNSNYDDFELMLIASGDIWIGQNSTNELTIYNEVSGMWNEVEALDDISINALTLVSDAQGTVWLAASDKFPQFLYRYDRTTNRIEPVELDIDGRLSQHVVELRTDSEGTLWILVGDYDTYLVELYSYIPATQQTTFHQLPIELMPSLIIFPDDHIGLISQQYKDDRWSNSLVQYYPETSEVTQNHIPSQIYELNDHDLISPRLFIDAYQRLWFDDRGWAEFSTGESVTWQAVIPSPVFIDVLKGHGLWYWGHPRFSAVSADGKLWYSSARGSGWLDSEKATWCIFTSYSSPVLLDGQQNLWLVAGGGLYKLAKN